MGLCNEEEFEDAIEAHLLASGWIKGDPRDFDRARALDPKQLFLFLDATQPKEVAKLRKVLRAEYEKEVLDGLEEGLAVKGTLGVLQSGFRVHGETLLAMVRRPASKRSPELLARYDKNRLVVTRQLKFIPNPPDEKKTESVDMGLFINGLPVATVELKVPTTHQTAEENAVHQYQRRDPGRPIFAFKKRTLVHFAVDPNLVLMTTRLARGDTEFLPFNKGTKDEGAGNPDNPRGYATAYLWEETWQRDQFLELFDGFVFVDRLKGGGERVVFPRYHQLDAVRTLTARARADGPGHNYLVQHSTGSGKSNTLAWLTFRLATLHGADDRPIFDTVVVITDRRILDRQLQTLIHGLERTKGMVQRIDKNSKQLADALKSGTRIVITTLQKFPRVAKVVGEMPKRRYAIVIDEAHSSQGGKASKAMKAALGEPEADEGEAKGNDEEYLVARIVDAQAKKSARARAGRQPNLSFFAFTATPKQITLEVFGYRRSDGEHQAHHVYSMRQALEEGFILDVLANYTPYEIYYNLAKKTDEDPEVKKRQAARAIARMVALHELGIEKKTEVMVEHFQHHVRPLLAGKAKAMVVASSRLQAVRYKQAFDAYLKKKGYDVSTRTLVAFSGTVSDPDLPGVKYTEVAMNEGIAERKLADELEQNYQILIVAEKYQTGFDQPLLHAMYVDDTLEGIHAVQTLSRLNRKYPDKRKPFVLDFIKDNAVTVPLAFQKFYRTTMLSAGMAPSDLHRLEHELREAGMFEIDDIEEFAAVAFGPDDQRSEQHQGDLYAITRRVLALFDEADEDARGAFREALARFIDFYGLLAQVLPFVVTDWEKLFAYGEFLLPQLPGERKGSVKIDGTVELVRYAVRKGQTAIRPLDMSDTTQPYGRPVAGSHKTHEDEPLIKLSELLDDINRRFGHTFTQIQIVANVIDDAKKDPKVIQWAKANEIDNFVLAMQDEIRDALLRREAEDQAFVQKFLDEAELQALVSQEVATRIYREIRGGR